MGKIDSRTQEPQNPKTSFFCFKYKNFKMWSLALIFIVTWQMHDPIDCAVVNKEPSPEGTRELLQRSKRDIQGIMTVSAKPAANSTSIAAAERERAANIITDFVGGARKIASTLAHIFDIFAQSHVPVSTRLT